MADVDPRPPYRDAALNTAAGVAKTGWDPARYARDAAFVPAMGAAVLELLAPRQGERVLDLGCGEGALTARIAQAGADVLGVDADAAMLAAARARGLRVEPGDGQDLCFGPEFDAVFSNAALHWMADGDAVAASVFRVLRPRGRFVGECGGHGNLAAIRVGIRAVSERHGLPWAEAQRYDSADQWADRLARAGFIDIDAKLIPRPTQLPSGMTGWLETFRGGFLAPGDAALSARILTEIEAFLAPLLRDHAGRWTADYVRLRFTARKPG